MPETDAERAARYLAAIERLVAQKAELWREVVRLRARERKFWRPTVDRWIRRYAAAVHAASEIADA